LAVVYGRRRCGKSRLLQQLSSEGIVYYLADLSDQSLQRQSLATQLSVYLPGFDAATFSSWTALFDALNLRNPRYKGKPLTLIFDEFPYLVAESPDLPSIIQKNIDTGTQKTHIILCGSSQRVMRHLSEEHSAPLYGRAREIQKLRPLKAGWIQDALQLERENAISNFSVWGGIPRYWELAAEYSGLEEAIQDLVFNRDSILHNEPRQILLDDLRTETQPHSILALIGAGVHRISEIAARLQKPAMNLTKPLEILTELGLVKKEVPFGESSKKSKRTYYTIRDPFCRFWYRFVYPHLSLLEQEMYKPVFDKFKSTFSHHAGGIWEDLSRESVPFLSIGGYSWKPACRWWGKAVSGKEIELDVVAESIDGSAILLGEVKWGLFDPSVEMQRLRLLSEIMPFVGSKKLVYACWGASCNEHAEQNIFSAESVLAVLR